MELEESLYSVPAGEYGPDYRSHLLEQYKVYVEMADRVSARRQSANAFFLSMNTALLAFVGVVARLAPSESLLPWLVAVCFAGVIVCYCWYRLVRSYKDLNSGKFKVIHAIEARLPLAPYDAEWVTIGKGENPKLYLPFTHVEAVIPWVYLVLYVGLAGFTLVRSLWTGDF
ncbi:MAG: hypothetical protein MUP80_02965 [Acidobacteriia bacterium]|nr:hypothetical protein [Terriglobia bacterium]